MRDKLDDRLYDLCWLQLLAWVVFLTLLLVR